VANLRHLAAAVALVMVPAAAFSHPPHEVRAFMVEGRGKTVELVEYRVDGILFADPVKLIVRQPGGPVLTETAFGRATASVCVAGRCYGFWFPGAFSVIPAVALHVTPEGVTAAPLGIRRLGLVPAMWEHGLGYLAALVFFFVPLVILRRTARLSRPWRGIGLGLFGVMAVLWWLVWFYVVAGLTELALSIVAALVVVTHLLERPLRVQAH
jgi:hypothetical protein